MVKHVKLPEELYEMVQPYLMHQGFNPPGISLPEAKCTLNFRKIAPCSHKAPGAEQPLHLTVAEEEDPSKGLAIIEEITKYHK